MHGGLREEGRQKGWFRLWRDLNMHPKLKKRVEPYEVRDEGGVLKKSNLMAHY